MEKVFLRLFKALSKKIIKGLSARPLSKNTKGDITKYFDRYVENYVIKYLKKNMKFRAKIVSEELKKHPVINSKAKTPLYTIIIDPVDGSDNYVKKIPFVCFGLAVFDENMEPVYSFAGNYYTGDYFYADKKRVKIKGKAKNPGKKTAIFTFSKVKPSMGSTALKFVNKWEITRSLGATIGEMLLVLQGKAEVFADLRARLTLENFAPFFIAVRHGLAVMNDDKGKPVKIKGLSLSRGYKVIFKRKV